MASYADTLVESIRDVALSTYLRYSWPRHVVRPSLDYDHLQVKTDSIDPKLVKIMYYFGIQSSIINPWGFGTSKHQNFQYIFFHLTHFHNRWNKQTLLSSLNFTSKRCHFASWRRLMSCRKTVDHQVASSNIKIIEMHRVLDKSSLAESRLETFV